MSQPLAAHVEGNLVQYRGHYPYFGSADTVYRDLAPIFPGN